MTVPNPDLKVPVPEPVYTAAKAVWAAGTSAAGVLALFITSVADGSISWAEGGTLLTAVLTAVATVGAVFGAKNKRKD
jgi:hypothetical protein